MRRLFANAAPTNSAPTGAGSIDPQPYEAIIDLGGRGIAARITGTIPRKLTRKEVTRLRALLVNGYSIQVLSPDRAAWLETRADVMQQLGFAGP